MIISPQTVNGTPQLAELDWGTKICFFYESKVDLLQTTVAYLNAGLEANEACVWAISAPVTDLDVQAALRGGIPDFERQIRKGSLQITFEDDWSIRKDEFNLQRITHSWTAKLRNALDSGYVGLRISGNAAWLQTHRWKEFYEYEQELGRSVAGRKIIVLCAQALPPESSEGCDEPAPTKHQAIACRNGHWGSVDMDALGQPASDAAKLVAATEQFSALLKRREIALTQRERTVLELIVRGVSSKRGGQLLGISPRTIEFHRSNIMQKLDVRNVAELVHAVMQNPAPVNLQNAGSEQTATSHPPFTVRRLRSEGVR